MVQAANPDATKLGDVAKLLGDKWKGMTEEERQPCAPTVRINFLSDGELTRALSADEDKNKQDVERYQTELAEWEKNHPKTRQDLKDFKVEDVIQDDSAYKNSLLGEERNEARASGLLVAANAWLSCAQRRTGRD